MSDDLSQVPGSSGNSGAPPGDLFEAPPISHPGQDIPDDFLGPIEEGGQAVAYLREKADHHVCFRCRHLHLVEEVIQTAGDVGQVMRERQGTCLITGGDVTNETRLRCSHFSRRWGVLGYLADALKAIRG